MAASRSSEFPIPSWGPATSKSKRCTTPSGIVPRTTRSWASRSSSPGRNLNWKRWFLKDRAGAQLTPELRDRIRASFDEASRNEEHFPSTIDPRIYHVKLIREHLG